MNHMYIWQPKEQRKNWRQEAVVGQDMFALACNICNTPSLQYATRYTTHCNRNPVPNAHTANDASIYHRTTTHNRWKKEHQQTSQLLPHCCLSTVLYSLPLGHLRLLLKLFTLT